MKNDETPDFERVKDYSDLMDIKDYIIENVTIGEESKVAHLFLKKETPEGTENRELMTVPEGKIYLTAAY
jgi:hypothetical protein